MTKANLLIDEPPLQVIPSLAKLIGLNEAIVLQQIHYWLVMVRRTRGEKLGRMDIHNQPWVYNSVKSWRKSNFPFWSTSTIRRILINLEDKGLIISSKEFELDLESLDYSSKDVPDQTLYYTINYCVLDSLLDGEDALAEPIEEEPEASPEQDPQPETAVLPFVQNEQMDDQNTPPFVQNEHIHLVKLEHPFSQLEQMLNKESETTRDYSETTKDGSEPSISPPPNLQGVWESTKVQLKLQMAPTAFSNWVQDLQYTAYCDGVLTLTASTAFGAAWVQQRLGTTIKRLVCVSAAVDKIVVLSRDCQVAPVGLAPAIGGT